MQPGPADDRIYVVDALNKSPYRYPYLPPHTGAHNPPPPPDPGTGHFDHLQPDTRSFAACQMYATVRRTLDIWEDYFEHTIEWHFSLDYSRIELIPLISWDNAHSGYGFLEFGFGRTPTGAIDPDKPHCMNFDVLAHELGHSIHFATVGFPEHALAVTDEFGGFGESAGDLVALVTALHSNLVIDHLLAHCRGNLFTENELSRIGELSESRQIRKAFNYERMSTVSSEPHDLSNPLTGALFDVFVEAFQKELVAAELISQQLADLSYHGPQEAVDDAEIQARFNDAYRGHELEFKTCLMNARDYLGTLLAKCWDRLNPNFLTYARIGLTLLAVDRELTGGAQRETIRDCFSWREIQFPADSAAYRSYSILDCARSAAGRGRAAQTERPLAVAAPRDRLGVASPLTSPGRKMTKAAAMSVPEIQV
jgi:hypothetical protein